MLQRDGDRGRGHCRAPHGGLGTVALEAVKAGRRGYTVELNNDYFRDAVGYLKEFEEKDETISLFDFVEGIAMEYIARISHGKDSLKMLDVIVSRGLPLNRITTTDIWATDTIRGEHPDMVRFKETADEYIWRKYRIEVEHLCAMRDGQKVTYEKMFYHIPQRKVKDAGGTVRTQGTILGFPTLWGPWCQSDLKRRAESKEHGARNSKPGF